MFKLLVATYNIRRCFGRRGYYIPELTAQVLCELGADIIALQEVDTGMKAGSGQNQLECFADATGLKAIEGPTIKAEKGYYGNAVLTRFAPSSVERWDLSVEGCEPRGAIDMTITFNGLKVRVISTHLGLHRKERWRQVNRLLEIAGDEPGNAVVMGDFNEWMITGRATAFLEKHLGKGKRVRTYPTWMPVFGIDRIWALPQGTRITTSRHTSAASRVASDHLPVKAVIEWDD